jgi:hypothetical protein
MAFVSHDPRDTFRKGIGTAIGNVDGIVEYCLQITYNGDTINIPMFLSEETRSENLPTMPYLEMLTVTSNYEPHDISASTRKMECWIDIHIWFTDTDNIDKTTFAKLIKDEMHDLVRTNQSITSGIFFMNLENDRIVPETNGRQVTFHYIASLYVLYYDLCI